MFGARVAFFLGFLSVTKERKLSVSKQFDIRKQVSFHKTTLWSTQEWHTFSSRHTQESSIPHTLISAELNLCCNIHTFQQTRPSTPTARSRASLAHKLRQHPWKLPLPKARKESWPTQRTLPPKLPFLPPEKNLIISGTSGQIGLKFEINDFQKFVLPPSWLDQSSRVKSISTSDSPADKTGNADIRVQRESGKQAATTSVIIQVNVAKKFYKKSGI